MSKQINELAEIFSEYLSASDVFTSNVLSKISYQVICKRINLKMNQKQFAKYMKVSQAMVSKWESGDYNFTVEAISKLCEKLNLTYEIQFKEQNEIKEQIENNLNKCQEWECQFYNISNMRGDAV